jgi:two-component system LytT family response regulator
MQSSATIMLNTIDGRYFFSPQEIIRLEASSNYTKIFFSNNTRILSSKVLKEFAEMLEPLGFLRTHRTHLVNKQYIHCITSQGVIMKDESVAEISRRQKTEVLRALKNRA